MSRQDEPQKGALVVCETSTSTWNYHLRVIEEEGFKPGGDVPPALCGKEVGWDTKVPVAAWNRASHIPERYCAACRTKALALGFSVPEGDT